MINLRPYQSATRQDLYAYMRDNQGCNPCAVLPTGAGKSIIVADLCSDALSNWPDTRILMLAPQKELIAQNYAKLLNIWPSAPVGVYSASLGRKDVNKITFATVKSIINNPDALGRIDIVIIDECHLVNHKQEGQYRDLISYLQGINPHLRVIGLTATPWRLGHGVITHGSALFDDLIEPEGASIRELLDAGYLSPLRSKVTESDINPEGQVKIVRGDFANKELHEFVNDDARNEAIVSETIRRAEGRRHWLFFCAGVDHAHQMARLLESAGISSGVVHGKLNKKDREAVIKQFTTGQITALCNCDILTTGFDFPDLDLIAMTRATMSPVLYMQMAGRGLRIKSHTDHCLVLDFAGNIRRHGPVTNVRPPKQKNGSGDGQAPIKVCDHCFEIVHASARECPACGEAFPVATKEQLKLYADDILGMLTSYTRIRDWKAESHTSTRSGRELLKIRYYPERMTDEPIDEYVCLHYEGPAGRLAHRLIKQIREQSGASFDPSWDIEAIAGALNMSGPPKYIEYTRQGKYYNITLRGWDNARNIAGIGARPEEIIDLERQLYAAQRKLKALHVSDDRIDEICIEIGGVSLKHFHCNGQQKMRELFERLTYEAANLEL